MNVNRIMDELSSGKEPIPLELGNVNAKRDWSYSPDFMDGVWRMLNQDIYNSDLSSVRNDMMEIYGDKYTQWLSRKLSDYVLSSGETHTIKEFVEKSFECRGITSAEWIGEGLEELFVTNGLVLVKIDKKYYRPAEVDVLLGDSSRVRKELGWKPKTTFDELVKIMVKNDKTYLRK